MIPARVPGSVAVEETPAAARAAAKSRMVTCTGQR